MAWFSFGKDKQAPAETPAPPAPQAAEPAPNTLRAGQTLRIAPSPMQAGTSRRQPTPETVDLLDEFGRPVQVRTEDFRTNILPGGLKLNWGKPDALYGNIVQGLQLNFAADVLAAARHLLEIDPDHERAAVVLAVVLRESGQPAESAAVLESQLAAVGRSALVLVNLAKAQFDLGREAEAEQTLWAGVQLDPNGESGVGWYVARRRDQAGETAYREALARVAALPGAWLPQMWMAQLALRDDDQAGALKLFGEALAHASRPAPALLLQSVTGDLGKKGLLAEALALAEPAYDASAHGVAVGNNMIKLALGLGQLERARGYVEQLMRLNRPEWAQNLQFWDAEVRKAELAREPAVAPEAQPPLIPYTVEGPLWLQPESAARPLFPPAATLRASPVVFHCATVTPETDTPVLKAHMADRLGRLSRMWPLFATETTVFGLGCAALSCIPYLTNRGFALFPTPYTDADAASLATQMGGAYAVSGHLAVEGDGVAIAARVLRLKPGEPVLLAEPRRTFAWTEAAAGLRAVLAEIHAALASDFGPEFHPAPSPARYTLPPAGWMEQYLLRLEQLLAVACAGGDERGPAGLTGEREMVRGMLDLSLAAPACLPARLILLDTLRRFRRLRPDVVDQFREPVMLLAERYPLVDAEANAVLASELKLIYP